MSHGHFLRALREFGVVGTFKKLYKMRTLKFGALIGTDRFGNTYWENTIDYPHGQHRWVEYSGDKSFYEVDSSTVCVEWHGWLHGITDEPPTEKTIGSTHRITPLAIASGSSAPYARNLGGVIADYTPNLSSHRPRGYGVGNGITGGSGPHEEKFYTQPGHPLDPRSSSRAAPSTRKERLGFSLRDTPSTLRAREAGRVGLTPDVYDKYTSAGGERIALLTAASPVPSAPRLDLPDLKLSPREQAVAERLAEKTGHARPWGADLEAGTFAAAVSETLSQEEEAFLAEGYDVDDLLAAVARYQKFIDEYADVSGADAADGVAKSTVLRDDAANKLTKLRAIQAKLAALAEKFDARVYEKAATA